MAESSSSESTATESLQTAVSAFETASQAVESLITKTCKVRPAVVTDSHRVGLVATQGLSKGEVILAMPYSSPVVWTAETAKAMWEGVLPDKYNGWTGDAGLMALLLLNELALASDPNETGTKPGIAIPKNSKKLEPRTQAIQAFLEAWLATLPHVDDMTSLHPLFWPEDDQEILQSSSTTKIYRLLDDIEEDATWMMDYIWKDKKDTFPETVTLKGREYPCFSVKGFTWAMALVQSRSFFLDGASRLIPFLDFVNHSDDVEQEVQGSYMGTFGTVQGAQLVADRSYKAGEQVFCSYGPKSAIDYLLEHVRMGTDRVSLFIEFAPNQSDGVRVFPHLSCLFLSCRALFRSNVGGHKRLKSPWNWTRTIAFTMTSWIFWNSKPTTPHPWIRSNPLIWWRAMVAMVNPIPP